jgi:3-dehydroquinate synthase
MEFAGTHLVDPSFFLHDRPGHRVIARAIELMVDELAKNPFEVQGLQRLVDFGHTFSPTLEALTDYSMLHGDAVAIDMMLTAEISHRLGLLRASDLKRMHAVFRRLDLPFYSPVLDEGACLHAIAGAMLHRGGSMNLVVPTAIGEAAFVEDPEVIAPLLRPSLLSLCRRAEADPQPDDRVGTAWSRAS